MFQRPSAPILLVVFAITQSAWAAPARPSSSSLTTLNDRSNFHVLADGSSYQSGDITANLRWQASGLLAIGCSESIGISVSPRTEPTFFSTLSLDEKLTNPLPLLHLHVPPSRCPVVPLGLVPHERTVTPCRSAPTETSNQRHVVPVDAQSATSSCGKASPRTTTTTSRRTRRHGAQSNRCGGRPLRSRQRRGWVEEAIQTS